MNSIRRIGVHQDQAIRRTGDGRDIGLDQMYCRYAIALRQKSGDTQSRRRI